LHINGEPASPAQDLRTGLLHHLEGSDRIVWLKYDGEGPLELEIISQGD
jgi:hypothetical protein